MVEPVAQTSTVTAAQANAAASMSEQEIERATALKYQRLNQETQALVSRLMEVEDEKRENELVLEQVSKLEDDRKCWRLINGILFEKNKAQVVPELTAMISNLAQVGKQINTTLVALKQEMMKLEQAYSSIMEQAKKRNNSQIQQQEEQKSAGGVLV